MKLSAFPELLPGEHIFSAAIRACRRISMTSTDRFFRDYFGVVPDLRPPSFIFPKGEWHLIVVVSRLLNQDPWQLALLHTNLPYFFNTLDIKTQKCLAQHYDELETSVFKLATHNDVFAPLHWRWCPDCAVEDFNVWGTTYWHTTHQLPGLIHCSKHRATVLVAHCDACGAAHHSLRTAPLPSPEGTCAHCGHTVIPPANPHPEMRQLERELMAWLEIPLGKFSADTLRQCYVLNARSERRINFGAIAPVGSAAPCTLNKLLEPRFAACSGSFTLEQIGSRFKREGEIRARTISLHRLLTSKNAIIHPLLHMLLIRFLFRTTSHLMDYRKTLELTAQHIANNLAPNEKAASG